VVHKLSMVLFYKNAMKILLIDIIYERIEIDDILFELSFNKGLSTQNLHKISKQKRSNLLYLIIAFVFTSLAAGYFIYKTVKNNKKTLINPQKQMKKEKNKKYKPKKITQILLPNHIEHNNFIKQLVLKIFDNVIDEVTLKKLQISTKETTFVFTYNNLKDLNRFNDKLNQIFEKNEVLLTSKAKNKFNSIISSSNLKFKEQKISSVYKDDQFSINEIKKMISKVFKKYDIKKVATFDKKFITNIYNIDVVSDSTKSFFAFINEINKQNKNIQINFPITFEKIDIGLEIKFRLYILYKKD